MIFMSTKFIGTENIPKNGSFIMASNHLSNLDPFIVGISCRKRFSYIAKDSLFKNKIQGFLLHHVGAFPIRRDTSDFRALRETIKRLKQGCPIILFPEGTRGASRRKKTIQSGVGLIALKSKKPVLPVFIKGSDSVLPPGGKRLKRSQVTVKIGKPLQFTEKKSYNEIAQEIMDNVYLLDK